MGASASIDVSTLSPEELTIYEKVKAAACVIDKVHAREVYDSRGNPTVEVELTTKDGVTHSAIVPSGASTGIYEACELRDGDKGRCMGKGVTKAVANVINVIAPLVSGKNCVDQAAIDDIMIKADGTPNKTNLGANAILGVSLACAKAGAAAQGIPLYQHFAALAGDTSGQFTMPTPCFNVINGGSHAGNKLAFQEYFVIPTGATSFKNAMEIGSEVYHNLKKVISSKFGGDATLIGDEGGFAPPCDVRTGVELVMEAIEKAGYAGKCTVGLDVAASEFKVEGEDAYDLDFKTQGDAKDPKAKISTKELGEMYAQLMKDFPVATIEDPFDQDDWQGWVEFTKTVKGLNTGAQVVGDDLTVTNVTRIKRAIDEKACDCLLLKVNQIGSVTESIAAVTMAKAAGWGIMTSHRSGETEDTCIADLAVGLRAGQIKSGAPCRSDRMAKYNQLLRIEEQLGAAATYPQGTPLFKSLDFAPPAAAAPVAVSKKPAKYTLVLVRHGHSEWNDSGQFTGWYDCDLAPQGVAEAEGAAALLKEGGFQFDRAFTSVLTRAKRTCKMCLEGTGQESVPVTEAWELNERHYGGLTGLNKQETVEKHGKEQVLVWRRSYDVPPPPLVEGTEYYDYFFNDPKYAAIKDKLPLSESLANTVARVMPYWDAEVAPAITGGQKLLVAAHGNSLRALLMSLDNIGQDVISELNLPTGVPLVYELDEDLKPVPHPDAIAPLSGRYLGDQEAIRAKILGVKNQTK